MENQHNVKSVQALLLSLSDDVLLELFKYLAQEDALNLAGTCRRLQALAYKNFNSITIYPRVLFDDGELYINNVFHIVGHHIKHLTMEFEDMRGEEQYFFKVLEWKLKRWFALVSENCNTLDTLTIQNLRVYYKRFHSNDRLADSIQAKSVFFNGCKLSYSNKLFRMLRKVECLVVQSEYCNTSDIDFRKFFRNNTDIKFFVCNRQLINKFKDPKLFEILPKLEKLCINIEKIVKCSTLYPLAKMDNLKHLELTLVKGINVNKFLEQLTVKQNLKQLDLDMIKINRTTVEILQKFVKLSDLTLIWSSNLPIKLYANNVWSSNLQRLNLQYAHVTILGFLSIIQGLRSLKTLRLTRCYISKSDRNRFDNSTQLSRDIVDRMDIANNAGKLEIFLNLESDFSKYQPNQWDEETVS